MDKTLVRRIKQLAEQHAPEMSAWRRHLHMHPEASMQEHDTAAFVVDRLQALGVEEIRTGVGETGVVAVIRGRGKKTVGLRADMDALELPEKNAVPYRSRRPGMMHACGHDGHVAGLLGVAAILQPLRDRLPGNVKLIFQPGEEGAGGAARMIRDGALENPKVSAIAALHVAGDIDAGKMSIASGYLCAQVDDVDITVSGKTGHAARPDKGVDAISLAGQLLIAAQQFVARHTNPLDRKVISIGVVHGGTRRNIVADEVVMQGTVRTVEPETREQIVAFLTRGLPQVARAMGGSAKTKVMPGYPPSYNDPSMAEVIAAAGTDIVGKENLVSRPRPVLGGEDFGYFGRTGIPAAMFETGIRDEAKGFVFPGHSSRFDFDDARVLPIGAAVMADSVVRMLERF